MNNDIDLIKSLIINNTFNDIKTKPYERILKREYDIIYKEHNEMVYSLMCLQLY